jgi:uncharacterized protein YkwD
VVLASALLVAPPGGRPGLASGGCEPPVGSGFKEGKKEIPGSTHPARAKLGVQDRLEEAIVAATNAERKKKELPPLEVDARLVVAAQRHAIAMAEAKKLAHELEGKGAADRVKDAGYDWGAVGENVAEGYEGAADVVAGWMKSEGHRENILDEKKFGFTRTGVGAHKAKDGTLYFCQVFARPPR